MGAPDGPDSATPFDVSGLIPTHITTRTELFIAEARNIAGATLKYLAATPTKRRAPFTLGWVYRLHKEMFSDVWKWAGSRRNSGMNIGVPVYQIDTDLKNLLDDLQAWEKYNSYPLLEQAVRLHHRAVQIHPFDNGNGRWARLLANIWLKRCKAQIIDWPDETIGSAGLIRDEYIAAIKAADQGDYALLIALHERYWL